MPSNFSFSGSINQTNCIPYRAYHLPNSSWSYFYLVFKLEVSLRKQLCHSVCEKPSIQKNRQMARPMQRKTREKNASILLASSATCHFPSFRTFQKKEQGLDIISKRRAKILVNFDLRLSKTTIMFSIF